MQLREHVAGYCTLQCYRQGNLIYRTSTGLDFPIPIADTGDATFGAQERGMLLMRWIRAHLNERVT